MFEWGNKTPKRADDIVGEALDAGCVGAIEAADDRVSEGTEIDALCVGSSSIL